MTEKQTNKQTGPANTNTSACLFVQDRVLAAQLNVSGDGLKIPYYAHYIYIYIQYMLYASIE